MLRKQAREQGYTEAEIDRIYADTQADIDKMTDLEVSAELLQVAKNTVRADPSAIHDREVLGAIYQHVENLLGENADVQATFKALLKPRGVAWSKYDARHALFRALRGCVFETAMGKPDRWPAVLELLRKGYSMDGLFPDMPEA
jgi:hypothetical protein